MLYFLLGWICVGFMGALLHFFYDFTHHCRCLGWFGAVNESVWEHLKIATVPTFIWGIIGLLFTDYNNIFFGILVCCITIYVIILLVFYIYTLITKRAILFIDILTFFFAIGIGCIVSYFIFTAEEFSFAFKMIGIIGDLFLAWVFVVFTYLPPHFEIFRDPQTKKFGIKGHSYCTYEDEEIHGHQHHHHKWSDKCNKK